MDRYRLSPDMRRAIFSISSCRMSSRGGRVNRCPDCDHVQIAYNSCMHRCCPQCAWLPRERWLRGCKERLLPVPHHHIVFTVSHLLNEIWRFNKKLFSKLLFRAVSETLLELLADPKYLGARPGLLAALHTWNQKLLPHIHIHVLVTAGGLTADNQWAAPKKDCLLPRKVLMLKFRGKFLSLLGEASKKEQLRLPSSWSEGDVERVLKQSRTQDWNVKIHDRYDYAVGVATYLARYIKGGPMGKSRLLEVVDDQVKYRYRISSLEGGDGKKQGVDQLAIETFLLRWLEHVPPRRFQTVRGFGLYGGNQHSRNKEARRSLGLVVVEGKKPEKLSCDELLKEAGYGEKLCCPKCGAKMHLEEEIACGLDPPSLELYRPTQKTRPVRKAHEVAC